MKLFPSFREAVKTGKADLQSPLTVFLVASYEYAKGHGTHDDVKHYQLGPVLSVQGEWEGEDPQTLHAGPMEWEPMDGMANGCILCAGDVLIGYEEFPKAKNCEDGLRLSWPDGVMVLS